MYKVIKFDQEEKYVKDFLALPKKLYSKKQIVQNEKEESELLLSKHILSKYFVLHKFLVYKNDDVCGRCILTLYPKDTTAYIGFFECIPDTSCAKALFSKVESFAAQNKYSEIVGPVDASFWLKYRLKINMFEGRSYISEPYNKEYYYKLFYDCRYKVSEEYISNIYEKLPLLNYKIEKYKNRYSEFIDKGYRIVSPKPRDWDKVIGEVYNLIINLYSDFPIFKYISEEDFRKLFESYKLILDFSMVKIAYFNNEAVGFFIGMPDYKNRLYGRLNIFTLLYVMLKKLRSSNYVMLYLGVSNEHHGLGKAITQTIMDNLHKKRATSIGAFIKKGKITENYAEERIKDKYQYVLLRKNLRAGL